jgi:hypothetical protein
MRFTLFVASAALLSAGITLPARAESMLDQIVINKCSSAMQADFDKAGKTPPAGLIQQTCTCVAQQLNETHNIEGNLYAASSVGNVIRSSGGLCHRLR